VECDEIQAPEWGEIEKGEVEAPRVSVAPLGEKGF
jgi:hypothetical protein